MEKNTENNFWKTKMGRYAIIGITYAVMFLVVWLISEITSRSGSSSLTPMTIVLLACAVLSIPVANKAVNYVNNAILGNLILFGPLQMFVQIFVVKLLFRILIALFGGIFIAPYTVGNFIANKIGAAKK